MIPLRDDRPGGGAPIIALLACIALLAGGILVPGGGIAFGIVLAIAGWLFTPSLFRESGAVPTLGAAALGGLLAGAGAWASGTTWPAWALTGAAAALVGLHLVRFRGSRMLALIPLPLRAGLTEIPSAAVAAVWAVPVCLLAAGA